MYAKAAAKTSVQIASHSCARRVAMLLTPATFASPVQLQSVLHSAAAMLVGAMHEQMRVTVASLHRRTPLEYLPSLTALVPMITCEAPKLALAASRYIGKDLIALGVPLDTALAFGERLQAATREQAGRAIASSRADQPTRPQARPASVLSSGDS